MEAKLFPESDALLIFYMSKLLAEERLDAGLPGPKKIEKAKFGHKQFLKRQNPERLLPVRGGSQWTHQTGVACQDEQSFGAPRQ